MSHLVWIAFVVFVLATVLLDLGVILRSAGAISLKEALAWTFIWVALALAFNALVFVLYERSGPEAATQFFTGYLLEKSLSVGNIFVIAMIFAYFRIGRLQQNRLLFWGILGAVLLRALMISLGALLFDRFWWLVYVFGVLLLMSAVKMMVVRHDNIVPERNLLVRLLRRFFAVSERTEGGQFFVIEGGKRLATPLLFALVLIASSDVMFAVDSIPAVFAVTRDPFLVFTSNIFAILGLRSLYFVLAGFMDRFRYLNMSLVFVLVYVGVTMLLTHHYSIPNLVSLAIIGGILAVGVLGSIVGARGDTARLASPLVHELEDLAVTTYRQARRVIILIGGGTVLLLGIAMIVLPGPAILVIPLGLGILAIEFAWARRWLQRVKRATHDLRRFARGKNGG